MSAISWIVFLPIALGFELISTAGGRTAAAWFLVLPAGHFRRPGYPRIQAASTRRAAILDASSGKGHETGESVRTPTIHLLYT